MKELAKDEPKVNRGVKLVVPARCPRACRTCNDPCDCATVTVLLWFRTPMRTSWSLISRSLPVESSARRCIGQARRLAERLRNDARLGVMRSCGLSPCICSGASPINHSSSATSRERRFLTVKVWNSEAHYPIAIQDLS